MMVNARADALITPHCPEGAVSNPPNGQKPEISTGHHHKGDKSMKWFKKPAVCAECGVHFEPAQGPHGSDLCSTHRKPALELERRKAFVLAWAAQHWQELEKHALMTVRDPVAAAAAMVYGNFPNLAAPQAAPAAGTLADVSGANLMAGSWDECTERIAAKQRHGVMM